MGLVCPPIFYLFLLINLNRGDNVGLGRRPTLGLVKKMWIGRHIELVGPKKPDPHNSQPARAKGRAG